jgi:hypothetical protein
MIARIWRGWAPLATADDDQRHDRSEVGGHLGTVSVFCGARLLCREGGQEVMVTSITFFHRPGRRPRFCWRLLRTGRRGRSRRATAGPLGRAGLVPRGSCRAAMVNRNLRRQVIIWLNGTFGCGKTSTAAKLHSLVPSSRVFDPETVGYMLQPNLADHPASDFQHWPLPESVRTDTP